MNAVFLALVAIAVAVAGGREIGGIGDPGAMAGLGTAMASSAQDAVTLGISLVGTMALFQGLMKVAEEAGLMAGLARLLQPLLVRLFPDVPDGHPAMGAMVMNIAANMLGLSNAATPFGVRAMRELSRLSPVAGTATNAMVLFLAINTANVTLLPTHVMALRAAAGSHDPAAVVVTTLFATLFSTGAAILAAKLGARGFPIAAEAAPAAPITPRHSQTPNLTGILLLGIAVIAIAAAMLLRGAAISPWVLPALFAGILLIGFVRGVPIYTAFVAGARDGIRVTLRLLPYLIAILVAVGMFRASGAMDMIIGPIGHLTGPFIPAQALILAALRTLSGSASFGYLATLLKDPAVGPDSYLGLLASTLYGSSETTFYVIAVYFGAAGVKRIRHALFAGLAADLCGLVAAASICWWMKG